MKILLAYPYFVYERVHVENIEALPMGMYTLAAVLRQAGHEVQLADWHAAQGQAEAVRTRLETFRPDVLGLSVFHANRWGGLDIAEFAKQTLPSVTTVFGGIGATFLDRLLVERFDHVDYVVRGEAERSFPALLEVLATGADPASTNGLTFRRNGKTVTTPDASPIEDLDTLPDPSEHFTFQHVALTRGCPGKCTFCGSPRFWGPRVRFHSAKYFVRQLERLHARGVNFFYVSDDTFTLKRELVLDICRLIRERLPDITWAAISRVDRVDEEVLKAMRLAGCIQLSFGVESGSTRIRQAMNKKTTNEQIERAFRLTTAHSILARAYVIYGNPGENDESIAETMALIRRIRPLVTLFHVMAVFPGTALWDELVERGLVTDEAWLERGEDLLWLEADPDLDADTVRAMGQRLKQDYYSRLSEYARSVELVDDPDLYPHHADFYSRLGLTLEAGDYASLELDDKEETLEHLYRKALTYADDARAYLRLGTLLTNRRDSEAVTVLDRGLSLFPNHDDMRLMLGAARMMQGDLTTALETLAPLEGNGRAAPILARCRQALDQSK